MIVTDICDPDRVRRLGVEGLRRYVSRRGVELNRVKAAQVIEVARVAFRLPGAECRVLGRVLTADLSLLNGLEAEIRTAEEALAEVLPKTPDLQHVGGMPSQKGYDFLR